MTDDQTPAPVPLSARTEQLLADSGAGPELRASVIDAVARAAAAAERVADRRRG